MIPYVRRHYILFCVVVYLLYIFMMGVVLYSAYINNVLLTSITLFLFLGIVFFVCQIEEKASKYVEDPIE